MKSLIRKFIVFFLRLFYKLFYKKEYIKGKYFNENDYGWFWILRGIWFQKILGFNRNIPWPVSHNITISNYKNLKFHSSSLNNFQSFGCYYQNIDATIYLCKNVYIAPNVGLITTNHDINDLKRHIKGKSIVIGSHSWIGMNSVILPGVKLGKKTIVGAGSVVTKSFRSGNVVIAGNPARVIKRIES